MNFKRISTVFLISLSAVAIYMYGHFQGSNGTASGVVEEAQASGASELGKGWSPTGTSPNRDVYYPGTEALAPDEMRVIACGSGMPMPRLKQAAACMLVELGNGDKFIFDMGTGSMERLYALGIPLDYLDKVFLTHLHADHMGDLPAFYIYGPQNNRSVPHVCGVREVVARVLNGAPRQRWIACLECGHG
jgi:hypothetical protein